MTFQDYNLDVPNPPNNPSQDVPLMYTNTNSISNLINIDHFGFKNNLGGYHQQVTLLNESAPGFGTASAVFFANLQGGQSWPFWQNAAGTSQLLSGIPSVNSANTGGYTYLPGGLLMQFGIATGLVEGSTTVGFSGSTMAFPNGIFAVYLQAIRGSTSDVDALYVKSISKSGFVVVNTSSSIPTAYFLALGT